MQNAWYPVIGCLQCTLDFSYYPNLVSLLIIIITIIPIMIKVWIIGWNGRLIPYPCHGDKEVVAKQMSRNNSTNNFKLMVEA